DVEAPRHLGFDGRGPSQQDGLARAHRRRRARRASVGTRDLFADERLDARARHAPDAPLEEMIQTPAAAFRRHDDVALDDVVRKFFRNFVQNLFSCVARRALLAAFASSRRRAPSINKYVVDAWMSSTPPTSPVKKSNDPAPQVSIR